MRVRIKNFEEMMNTPDIIYIKDSVYERFKNTKNCSIFNLKCMSMYLGCIIKLRNMPRHLHGAYEYTLLPTDPFSFSFSKWMIAEVLDENDSVSI